MIKLAGLKHIHFFIRDFIKSFALRILNIYFVKEMNLSWLKWFLYRWLSSGHVCCFAVHRVVANSHNKFNALNDIRLEQLASLVCV